MAADLSSPETFDIIFETTVAVMIIAAVAWKNIERRIPPRQARNAVQVAHLTPVQFEHHCADVLRSLGWKCKTTRASGDFGIDLIAEHGGHRVVFQIKKWSKPVNLSAVQEAVAGIAIYGAHSACVISISGYQQSAFKLAAANKVHLMSYQDLRRFSPPTSQGWLSRLRQKRLQ